MAKKTKKTEKTEKNSAVKFVVAITEAFFVAVAHQRLAMHKAICEPIDNAISNAIKGLMANILVSIDAVDDDHFRFTIADWGTGMSLKELINALQFGSLHERDEGELCIYGQGLKNFLLVASQNKYDWFIASKHPGDKAYNFVTGPFSTTMEVTQVSEVPLKDIVMRKRFGELGEPSTIVSVVTDKNVASTMLTADGSSAPLKVTNANVLRRHLAEHLGLRYRRALTPDMSGIAQARILLTNLYMVNKKVEDVFVLPVNQTYLDFSKANRAVEIDGYHVSYSYIDGDLDKDLTNTFVAGGYKPLHYYQYNQPTQGLDIELGNRVIETSQIEAIWPDKKLRHNQFNNWTGVINIDTTGLPRGFFNTLSNKSSIDITDKHWQALFEDIRVNAPMLYPHLPKISVRNNFIDAEAKRLMLLHPENDVKTFHQVTANRMVIDILDVSRDGTCEIHDYKAGQAISDDIANMVMKWNGMLIQGYQPKVAYIHCRKIGPMLMHTINGACSQVQAMTPSYLKTRFSDVGGVFEKLDHYNIKVVIDENIPK